MNKIHREITEAVKNAIAPMPIVFPVEYGKLYREIAEQSNIEIPAEHIFAKEMLDERMIRYIASLCECGDQALMAMQTNDMEKLQEVIRETQKLRAQIGELQKIVYEDPLTKSFNRKWFDDTYLLNDDHLRLRGEGTLVLIDINRFKEINDTYGHIIGDKVLTHLALKLKESGGRVVRYGGDEFLLIFDQDQTIQDIETKMKNMLAYWKKTSFKSENYNFKITFSYGTASFSEGSEAETVISNADKAMYRHKSEK